MKTQRYMSSLMIIALLILVLSQLPAPAKGYIDAKDILIVYRSDQDLDIITDLGCNVERIYRMFNIILAHCPNNVVERLRSMNFNVFYNYNVSIDVTIEKFKVLTSSIFDYSRYQHQEYDKVPFYWSWAISRVSSDIVWSYLGEEGADSVIAILDTGIDPTHPLIAGKLIGWIEFDSKGRPICSLPHDTHGHGTWVASIAAGGDGAKHIFGVAPKSKILSASVLPGGKGTVAQVLAGLEWVLEPYNCRGIKLGIRKPDVVSMSFGATGNYSNVLLLAIAKVIENGIIPVAAIGNSGPYTSSNPGNIWGVIGVGAVDLNNDVAVFSSYEEVEWPDPPETWPFKGRYPNRYIKPDIVAPGVDVAGAFPGGLIAIGSGTSAAAPVVAGIAAIVSVKLRSQGFSGALLVEKVYDVLTSTTMAIDHPGAGKGLIDAYLSVARAKGVNLLSVDIDVHAHSAKPLDRISLSINGVKEGEQIDIYISGAKVYSGLVSSKPITVEIPVTHMYMNTITVVDSKGVLYGKDFIYILPQLLVDYVGFWGKEIKVLVTGIGIGDTLGIYLGNNLLTLDFANLRGSYISYLLIPYAEKGEYNLTVIDFSTPTITLTSSIVIRPYLDTNVSIVTQTVVHNITNTYIVSFPVAVNLKQYYIAGSIDFIDIVTYNITLDKVSVLAVYPAPVTLDIVNVTSLGRYTYRLWMKIGSQILQETYAVINVTLLKDGVNLPYILVIRIIPKDPYEIIQNRIEEMMYRITQNMTTISMIYSKLENIEDIEMKINRLNKDINNMSMDLYLLNSSIRSLAQRIDIDLKEMTEKADHVTYTTFLAIVLAVISIIITIRLSRKTT
ncbi:MAG: S8 family serine peptidase [Ignisphaera sp.]